MTDTVGIYARISIDRQGRREGVDAQEKWGRAYAEQTWPGCPVRVFADNDLGAASEAARPGYDALRAAVRAGELRHLWCVEQSRLERREVQWFELAAELDAAGIAELHTNRDGIVRVRDEVAGIKAVLNAGEVRKLKRRVNDKLAENAAKGRPHGGVPFGYTAKDEKGRLLTDDGGNRTLAIVPEQAEALRWAADAVLSGWSLTNVARKLTTDGHRGHRGGSISAPAVRQLLNAPTIAGFVVRRGEIVGRGNWPAILVEDVWQAVRSKLANPRLVTCANGTVLSIEAHRLGVRPGRKYLLTSGLARCGVCGAALTGLMKTGGNGGVKKPYYQCLHVTEGKGCVAIVLVPTEEYVRDRLLAELDKPDFLAAVAADDHAERRDELARALTTIDAQRAELADLWGAGGLSTTEWQAARSGLDQREQRLRSELAAIPAPTAPVDIGDVRAAWPAMTLDEQREILRMFIDQVVIRPARPGTRAFDSDRVEIEWRAGSW